MELAIIVILCVYLHVFSGLSLSADYTKTLEAIWHAVAWALVYFIISIVLDVISPSEIYFYFLYVPIASALTLIFLKLVWYCFVRFVRAPLRDKERDKYEEFVKCAEYGEYCNGGRELAVIILAHLFLGLQLYFYHLLFENDLITIRQLRLGVGIALVIIVIWAGLLEKISKKDSEK